ncbi:MAG: hypothetical protein ACR2QM_15395 [Longimicrobiales bacterium]
MTSQTNTKRWAGFAILISALVILVNITLFGAFFGNVPAADPAVGPTPLERATHLSEEWGPLSTLWVIEVGFYTVMAIAATVLVTRTDGGLKWWPRPAAWAAVAVGATIQVAMYAFMLGGYAAAIPVVETNPGLLDAMYRSPLVLFYAGNAAMFAGFGAAYSSEATASTIVTSRTAWVGAAVCYAAVLLLLAVAALGLPFVAAAPFALVAHGFMAYLGFRLGRNG